MDTIFIAPLEQLGREDLDWAGGKGANLGELVKAGIPRAERVRRYHGRLRLYARGETGLGRTIATMLEEGLTAPAQPSGRRSGRRRSSGDRPGDLRGLRDLLGAVAGAIERDGRRPAGAAFAGQQDTST